MNRPRDNVQHRALGRTLFALNVPGLLLAAVVSAVWWLGRLWGDSCLQLCAAALSILLVLSLLAALVAAFLGAVLAQRSSSPIVATVCHRDGTEYHTNWRLPRWVAAFGSFSIAWTSPAMPESDVTFTAGQESIHPSRRFAVDRVTRRITVRDHLGLFGWARDESQSLRVTVYAADYKPETRNLPDDSSGEEPVKQGQPQGEREELRAYQHGDSMRLVLWQLAARTGGERMFVRTPERTGKTIALFLLAGPDDERNAGLVQYLCCKTQHYSSWLLGTSASTAVATSADQPETVKHLLASSGSCTPNEKDAEAHFAAFEATAAARQINSCVVFCTALPGWLRTSQRLRCEFVNAVTDASGKPSDGVTCVKVAKL